MIAGTDYVKTDYDFSLVRSVLSVLWIVVSLLLLGGVIVSVIMISNGAVGAGFSLLGSTAIAFAFFIMSYSLMVGFFELIKHAREIRNELVALRSKTSVATSTQQKIVSDNSAGLRYDPVTHQYIKN